MSVRILVVDDFEPWRRFIRRALRDVPDLCIVCEGSDGVEAVQKAAELRPDMILLDIGLPMLNGIAAARQIREFAPEIKVLFVSQETSPPIVQEAFRLGAAGYVVKADAATDLLTAFNTILQGERFIGARFADHEFALAEHSTRSDIATAAAPRMRTRHELLLYSDENCFLDNLARFIATVLNAHNSVITVTTASHEENLLPRLQAKGLNIAAAVKQGRYVPLNSADTLSEFMTDGLPDVDRFFKLGNDLMRAGKKAAGGERPRVAACGECAPFLWAQGKAEAALRVERLWDELGKTHGADILCGYPHASFRDEPGSNICQQIRAEHSAVHSF